MWLDSKFETTCGTIWPLIFANLVLPISLSPRLVVLLTGELPDLGLQPSRNGPKSTELAFDICKITRHHIWLALLCLFNVVQCHCFGTAPRKWCFHVVGQLHQPLDLAVDLRFVAFSTWKVWKLQLIQLLMIQLSLLLVLLMMMMMTIQCFGAFSARNSRPNWRLSSRSCPQHSQVLARNSLMEGQWTSGVRATVIRAVNGRAMPAK